MEIDNLELAFFKEKKRENKIEIAKCYNKTLQ